MSEPSVSIDELLRGKAAMSSFIRRWGLPLNPQDADLIVWAVLHYARTGENDFSGIAAGVDEHIDDYEADAARMHRAMRAAPGDGSITPEPGPGRDYRE
ncbi:hypothetical protein [Actinoplanes siamensis]|uniref:Uncharacterized protein n=1 Tax=Actinoplanes siamensis TaxID=1223317 RepID=A0A919N772_9ACTN|nr:hypothetical protein [Actinoplanes siamensis]GIF05610.1 hypothetical protein Asi03nite_31480 [Actinoplanes siamensis]